MNMRISGSFSVNSGNIPDVEEDRGKRPLGATQVDPDDQAEPLAHQGLKAGQDARLHQVLLGGQSGGCAAKASDHQCPYLGFHQNETIAKSK